MRAISHFFSLRCLAILLVSISTLTTAYAIPFRSDYIEFDRRAPNTVTVNGKVAELGARLSSSSHDKSTVWRLNKWDGKTNPGYVLKKYTNHIEKDRFEDEVYGLEAVDQFIAFDLAARVLVMKEVKGRTLAEMTAELPHDQRRNFLNKWRPKVAEAAAAIAKSKNIYHGDMNMDSIIIDGSNNIQFIDWEYFAKWNTPGFLSDKGKIEEKLKMAWDSTATPPRVKKSNSPGTSGKKSSRPRGSPRKKSRSPSGVKKSGSPKRRSPHRREMFYN
ncbi:hypothetical protein NLJ89_g830 [Agrocybe chaxingu]|uniref:Uncharacterized protein n=1 Tax=Agrocybe chaxingu TaxID=84603 RepID=A0A9W8TG41_9AGAR|nr:hypothetical protein NLJ89_g830 [Agrocybe chaxingu]